MERHLLTISSVIQYIMSAIAALNMDVIAMTAHAALGLALGLYRDIHLSEDDQ